MARSKSNAGKSNKLSLGMKCGDCLHYKGGPKSPLYANRCSELGTKQYKRACEGFTPNFTELNRRDGSLSAAARIAKLTADMNPKQVRILGYLLSKQVTAFDKAGIRFGQPMYVYLEPTVGLARTGLEALKHDDFHYLENYYKAYVIGMTDLGDGVREVYLASAVEGKPDYYVSVNIKEGEKLKRALTEEEFEARREKLIADKRKRMPRELRKRLEKIHELAINPPENDEEVKTLDDIPYEWWASGSHNADEKKARRNRSTSLHKGKRKKFKPESVDKELATRGARKPKLKGKKSGTRINISLT